MRQEVVRVGAEGVEGVARFVDEDVEVGAGDVEEYNLTCTVVGPGDFVGW